MTMMATGLGGDGAGCWCQEKAGTNLWDGTCWGF